MIGLQVAPLPRSSRPVLGCVFGLPRVRSPSAEPASEPSGCPAASDLWRCRRWSARVASNLHAFGVAGFQRGSGLPRWLSPPPATPAIQSSGCPSSCISGFTGDRSSSRLDSRILRRCRLRNSPGCPGALRLRYRRRSVSGLPRDTHPPAPADNCPSHLGSPAIRFASVDSPGCPGFLNIGYGYETNFQVALNLVSLHRSPIQLRFESPRTSVLRLTRICFASCPASHLRLGR